MRYLFQARQTCLLLLFLSFQAISMMIHCCDYITVHIRSNRGDNRRNSTRFNTFRYLDYRDYNDIKQADVNSIKQYIKPVFGMPFPGLLPYCLTITSSNF